ncbi:hypothetical protein NQ315_009574 [Exocentrus adspersus]|uniref:Chitin-binding type-2 domain-containing protein n=1 Tax=Exocentrus adspersus TaxID=1586481 RepID=A0AAV8WGZ5_9CUCU|nr:hypothetical protein NQ315_009574 [Exocentrus adspersus]
MLPAVFFLVAISFVAAIPVCPPRDGRSPTFFEHKRNCNLYYECSNGRPYLMHCPTGLHFNKRLNVCDYPYRAGCWYYKADSPQSEEIDSLIV